MPSAVAGIIGRDGGLRVVVTQRWRMRHHVGKGEKLFVVPDYEVEEPVLWDDIAPLIARVQRHVSGTLAPVNHCGDCRACCTTLFIKDGDFEKPSNQTCRHVCATGCAIYWRRPSVCRTFVCNWLASQTRNDRMGPELRPDRCGVIFSADSNGDPLVFEVHGEPDANAWRFINDMQRIGYKARKVTHYVGEDEP